VIHILTKFHCYSENLLTFIYEYYPIYKITQRCLSVCYIWMQHLSFKGIRIQYSCRTYLRMHVHVISHEDCDYINLVSGKYQYTETGFANLEDELS
jgi:hypothetical protein